MKTRALTTSELNRILINKGFNCIYTVKLDATQNKWGADRLSFSEGSDGYSYCGIYNFRQYDGCPEGCGNLISVASYAKLNAADKKEFQKIVESL